MGQKQDLHTDEKYFKNKLNKRHVKKNRGGIIKS